MKIQVLYPKERDKLKSYGLVKSDNGHKYEIVHFKSKLPLSYICTCKGYLFYLDCKHLRAYKKREK